MTVVGSSATRRLRAVLRRDGDALPNASIGTVPILWNNADIVDLSPTVDAETVLDEIARTGYEGTQEGRGFPRGEPLRRLLAARELRLAEVYLAIPCTQDGPVDGALEVSRDRLLTLHEGGGDVLVAAAEVAPERSAWAGRADDRDAPTLTAAGWSRLAALVDTIGADAEELGHALGWHPHAGTYVETPAELDRLLELTDARRVGVCLDTGHWTVAGGDPVETLRRLGGRVVQLHLKDVDGEVLAALRAGTIPAFEAAIRARLFTELGAGVIDLPSILAALEARGYAGWLMVEQDSCWGPPSESAAIGRRVLAQELRRLGVASAQ